jgi:hypothetical protein
VVDEGTAVLGKAGRGLLGLTTRDISRNGEAIRGLVKCHLAVGASGRPVDAQATTTLHVQRGGFHAVRHLEFIVRRGGSEIKAERPQRLRLVGGGGV